MENRLSEFEELRWFDCEKGDNWFEFLRPFRQFIEVPIKETSSFGYEGCEKLGDLAFAISMQQVELLEESDFSTRSFDEYDFPLEAFGNGLLEAKRCKSYEKMLVGAIERSEGLLRETLILFRKAVRLAIRIDGGIEVLF